MIRRTSVMCLFFILLPLQTSWSQQSAESSLDGSKPITNDEKLESVQEFLKVLEEAYSCKLIVNSADKLTDSLTISIVGRGDSCDDAIDTLLQEFQPPDVTIVAKIADPKLVDDEVDAQDCMEGFGCERDLRIQDTIFDPGTTSEPQ